MTETSIARAERLRLADHPTLSDAWLRERIVEDPSLLGLGDLCLADEGRLRDGRLELLLRHPVSGERFTVLVRMGTAEDGDLVRALEQWTIERSRYPEHEHYAVIIAEQLLPRFLISACALGESLPLTVMQFGVLRVAEHTALNFTPILNRLPRQPALANGARAALQQPAPNGNGNGKSQSPVEVMQDARPRVLDDAGWREQLEPEPAQEVSDHPAAYHHPRRRRRRNSGVFSFICFLSLFVCLAAIGAGVRSYSVRDAYTFTEGRARDHVIYSDQGSIEWILPASSSPSGRERYVKIPYWLPVSIAGILPIAWLVRGRSRTL